MYSSISFSLEFDEIISGTGIVFAKKHLRKKVTDFHRCGYCRYCLLPPVAQELDPLNIFHIFLGTEIFCFLLFLTVYGYVTESTFFAEHSYPLPTPNSKPSKFFWYLVPVPEQFIKYIPVPVYK